MSSIRSKDAAAGEEHEGWRRESICLRNEGNDQTSTRTAGSPQPGIPVHLLLITWIRWDQPMRSCKRSSVEKRRAGGLDFDIFQRKMNQSKEEGASPAGSCLSVNRGMMLQRFLSSRLYGSVIVKCYFSMDFYKLTAKELQVSASGFTFSFLLQVSASGTTFSFLLQGLASEFSFRVQFQGSFFRFSFVV